MKQFDLFGSDEDIFLKESEDFLKKMEAKIEELEKESFQEENEIFEWDKEFPQLCDENGNFEGFDIVIGNPPYIDHKKLKNFSNFFKKNYKIYSGTADISVYFFELALNILKKEKIFAFITTNKFFKTEYGKNLRNLLNKNQLLKIIDFEQVPIFDKALVSTSIIIGKKIKTTKDFEYSKFEKESVNEQNLTTEINKRIIKFNPKKINSKIWKFVSPEKEKIINKIEMSGKQIKDYETIKIRRGITTGYNEAFIIDDDKKNELIAFDKKNEEIIKAVLRGRDIKKYGYKFAKFWILMIRKNIDIEKYPKIKEYLKKHKKKLSKKAGNNKWYELQANPSYDLYESFKKQKIIWALTSNKWGFCLDNEKYFLISGAFFLTSEKIPIKFIMAILNSKLMKFYFSIFGVMTAGGAFTLKRATIERFTLSEKNHNLKDKIIKKIDEITRIKNLNKDIKNLECEMDILIYKLYNLTKEEIKIIENETI